MWPITTCRISPGSRTPANTRNSRATTSRQSLPITYKSRGRTRCVRSFTSLSRRYSFRFWTAFCFRTLPTFSYRRSRLVTCHFLRNGTFCRSRNGRATTTMTNTSLTHYSISGSCHKAGKNGNGGWASSRSGGCRSGRSRTRAT